MLIVSYHSERVQTILLSRTPPQRTNLIIWRGTILLITQVHTVMAMIAPLKQRQAGSPITHHVPNLTGGGHCGGTVGVAAFLIRSREDIGVSIQCSQCSMLIL